MTKIILGIESSCDDSAVAIITSDRQILANIVLSQTTEHMQFQGVVPEIASRAHLNYLESALHMALSTSSLKLSSMDLIAATGGPGLIGGVIVGTMYAKAIAAVLQKPYIAVNHLEGHALTIRLTEDISYPYLLLLVSGGHCQFIGVMELGKYILFGQTLDDAVGEAFDKVAKMLNLGYPGGPIIEQRALLGDYLRFPLPMPMYNRSGCDMSFSGLKTAVKLLIRTYESNIDENFINDLCASFQYTIVQILKNRLLNAVAMYEAHLEINNPAVFTANSDTCQVIIAGGVAANQYIISNLKLILQQRNYRLSAPPIKLCTDNAAMIAWAGYERWRSGKVSTLDFCPKARWPLQTLD